MGGVLTAQFASASPPGGVALPPVPAARVRAEALAAALGDASVAATAVTSAAGGTSSSTAAGCVATASPPLPGVGYKFHAAGREDVDVRMLGRGRPCLVELMDARRVLVPAPAFAALQRHINAVAATSLPFLPDVESGEGGEGAAYPPSTPLIGLRWLAPATKVSYSHYASWAHMALASNTHVLPLLPATLLRLSCSPRAGGVCGAVRGRRLQAQALRGGGVGVGAAHGGAAAVQARVPEGRAGARGACRCRFVSQTPCTRARCLNPRLLIRPALPRPIPAPVTVGVPAHARARAAPAHAAGAPQGDARAARGGVARPAPLYAGAAVLGG